MELRHLRYFITLAEERHFGRAAKRLHIAQPPLSRQIQALEAELGFLLLERTRRRVEMTAAGEAFLIHARRVFEAVDLAIREARRAAGGETGRIAVGYPSSVAFSGLTELLRAFRSRSPGIDIMLRELSPQEQIDALKERRIDVGFVRGPEADPEIATRLVRSETLVVALPSQHPLRLRKRIALELLEKEPFVIFPRHRGPSFFDLLMRLCHAAGFMPRIVQEAPVLDLVSLVAAGFGVSIVPSSFRNARRPGLVFRPIVGSPKADLLVAWRPGDDSPILQDFLETVARVGVRRHRT